MDEDDLLSQLFGKNSLRPTHPDVAKLSEVLLRMDNRLSPEQTDEQREAEWERTVIEAGIDPKTVSWAAAQRGLRAVGIGNETPERQARAKLIANIPQVTMAASVWIDGFIAGALYRAKGEEPSEINTSAELGEAYIAKVEYADGGVTLHGPFATEEKAWAWLDERLELDYKDIAEGYEGGVLVLNLAEGEAHE